MDFFDLFAENRGVPKREARMENPCPEPQPPSCPEMPGNPGSGCEGLPEDPCGMVLAMAYVPMQKWGQTYEPQMGLEQGTIFPELNLPFQGRKGCPGMLGKEGASR